MISFQFPVFWKESWRHVLRENKRIFFCLSDFVKNRGTHFEDFLGKVGGLIPLNEKNRRAGANYRGMLVSWPRNV